MNRGTWRVKVCLRMSYPSLRAMIIHTRKYNCLASVIPQKTKWIQVRRSDRCIFSSLRFPCVGERILSSESLDRGKWKYFFRFCPQTPLHSVRDPCQACVGAKKNTDGCSLLEARKNRRQDKTGDLPFLLHGH